MQKDTIEIDGSYGEGGGQILRTSLALSMITGVPIHIKNIRASRKKPGLMRQHLVCVEASRRVSNAEVVGATLHSTELHFSPRNIQSGNYEFKIGSAGSSTLVLQTLLPALLLAENSTTIKIEGGTHNPLAPSADFIERSFLSTLRIIGVMVDFELNKAGFAPIGGGKITATIHPWMIRRSLDLAGSDQKGNSIKVSTKPIMNAYACALNLTDNIALRELDTLDSIFNLNDKRPYHMEGTSQGNSLFMEIKYPVMIEDLNIEFTQVFTALGQHKKSSETVAKQFARQVKQYLKSPAMVDEYLADQLLLPMALSRGGKFTTMTVSQHTQTQADMIKKFIDCDIRFTELADKYWLVEVIR